MSREIEVIGWDLDSTVWDTRERWHMIPKIRAGEATWLEYSMACKSDVPIPGSVAMMRLLARHYRQVAISGRNQCAFDLTWEMTRHHEIPLDEIILRPDDCLIANAMFKAGQIQRLALQGYKVKLFMEDTPDVGEFITAFTGVPVMVVNPCYPAAAISESTPNT